MVGGDKRGAGSREQGLVGGEKVGAEVTIGGEKVGAEEQGRVGEK